MWFDMHHRLEVVIDGSVKKRLSNSPNTIAITKHFDCTRSW